MPETIPADRISTEGTQTRAELNYTVINEYAEAYAQGIELPPIDVYYDEGTSWYWLADGFHRLRAAQQIGRDAITANVHPGNQRDAILHAVGANERHGLRRGQADRRRAVLLLLNDPEWSGWANTEIARQCNVSEFLVRTMRSELKPAEAEPVKERTRKARRGTTTYPIKVDRIGTKKSKRETPGVPGSTTTEPQHHGEAHPMVSPIRPSSIISKMESTVPDITAPDEPPALDVLKVVEEAPFSAVSVLSAAAAAELSLEDAWEWATQTDRESFVGNHRAELQKIFRKLEKAISP